MGAGGGRTCARERVAGEWRAWLESGECGWGVERGWGVESAAGDRRARLGLGARLERECVWGWRVRMRVGERGT